MKGIFLAYDQAYNMEVADSIVAESVFSAIISMLKYVMR